MSEKQDVNIQKVTSRLVDEQGFDPGKAQQVAAEYRDLVVFDGMEEDVAMELAKKAVEEQYREGERPNGDFDDYNSKASIHAETRARRGADEYEDNLNMGTESFVETAREEVSAVEETAEETDWDEVERELELRLKERLMNEEIKAEIRKAITQYANYDYTRSEVEQFANDIVRMVAEDEAAVIANELVREMETGDIDKEQENIRTSMQEKFTREMIGGAAGGVAERMYGTLSKEGLRVIGSIIGSGIVGATVF